MSLPFLGLKNKPSKKHCEAGSKLCLFFGPEDRGDMFFLNVG
jgi:hypothetical protein